MTWAGFIAIAALQGAAQDVAPHDPIVIKDRLNLASAVVVGRFEVDRCLPWFDGWHCRGTIHIAESPYGDWRPGDAVRLRWKERFGGICLVCERLSQIHGKSGIWFLTKNNDAWKLTPTKALLCNGAFPIDERQAVIQAIDIKGLR